MPGRTKRRAPENESHKPDLQRARATDAVGGITVMRSARKRNPLREVRAGVSECTGLPERLTHVVR